MRSSDRVHILTHAPLPRVLSAGGDNGSVSVHTTGFASAGVYWLCGLGVFCAHTLLTHLTHSCIRSHWLFARRPAPSPSSFSQSCFWLLPFLTECLMSFKVVEKGHLAREKGNCPFCPLICSLRFRLPTYEVGSQLGEQAAELARHKAPGFLRGAGGGLMGWGGGGSYPVIRVQTLSPLWLAALIPPVELPSLSHSQYPKLTVRGPTVQSTHTQKKKKTTHWSPTILLSTLALTSRPDEVRCVRTVALVIEKKKNREYIYKEKWHTGFPVCDESLSGHESRCRQHPGWHSYKCSAWGGPTFTQRALPLTLHINQALISTLSPPPPPPSPSSQIKHDGNLELKLKEKHWDGDENLLVWSLTGKFSTCYKIYAEMLGILFQLSCYYYMFLSSFIDFIHFLYRLSFRGSRGGLEHIPTATGREGS